MDFIISLFWLGLIITLASLVFGLVLGAFWFILSAIVMIGMWIWEKLTGKSDGDM